MKVNIGATKVGFEARHHMPSGEGEEEEGGRGVWSIDIRCSSSKTKVETKEKKR